MKKNLEEKVWVARIAIYIIAFIEFFSILLNQFTKPDNFNLYNLIIAAAIAGVFIVLSVWAKEKPFAAILTTLIIYLAAIIFDVSINGMNILHGIIFRGAIFIFLIRGIDAAGQLQQLEQKQNKSNSTSESTNL